MYAGWNAMHQPVEWDISSLLPNAMTQAPAHEAHQPQTYVPPLQSQQSLPAPAFQGWSSMHQPVDWETASVPPAAAQPSIPFAPSAAREASKRDRAGRRSKSATLRPQQQQMLDLQKRLDALLQEHVVVEAENARLKTRLRVLEAVIPVREHQARLAQSQPPRAPPQQPDPMLACLMDMASGPSSCATSPTQHDFGGCLNMTSRAAADDACYGERKPDSMAANSPAIAPHAPDSSVPCSSGAACASSSCTAAITGTAGCAGGADQPVSKPYSTSEARWLDTWRTWVREAALLLQANDARPNELYVRRLEDAFAKLKAEVVYLGLRHPELICNMRCVNMETGAENEVPPDSFWTVVAAGMRLTSAQISDCRSALALYRERMSVVLAERRTLATKLSAAMNALQAEEAEGRASPGSMRRDQLTFQVEEVTAALAANVEAEGHTTSLARDLLGSSLFSRVQCARGSVLSYPYFPDALAIITHAVALADEANAAAAGTAGKSTEAVPAAQASA
ncbi:hypothetical protein Agub_g4480 [Astrephomene gubernaculifera]|uniref:Uncharacterized protein n=1 Tax=Astrephomene gubernaculifera TaxID=47775 RepID=A0AAD3HK80_9CHLO|nr:hypothetical protein Agub_g4480 [Astrephomene gubernaculifera]